MPKHIAFLVPGLLAAMLAAMLLMAPVFSLAQPRHGLSPHENRWIHSLPEDQQATARAILREAMPEIAQLRKTLRDKVEALADLNYDEDTPPESLPQLGRELQETRNALRERLARLDRDLREAVGSTPASLHRHGQRLRKLDMQGLSGEAGMDKN